MKRPTNAGAPRARTWSHKETSKRNRYAPRDDRTIKRTAPPCDLRRANWMGKHPCVVRILPNFNYEDPTGPFDPTWLDPSEDGALSDWWRSVPGARSIGLDQTFTFLLYDPRLAVSGDYDPNTNPYIIFSRAIMNARKSKTGEAIVGGRNVMTAKWTVYTDKKMIRYPQNLGFAQALFYQNGDDVYVKAGHPIGANEKDLPQILQVTGTAENSLLKMVSERVDGYSGDPMNQREAFAHGDIVDLAHGKFVVFYDPGTKTEDIISLSGLFASSTADDDDAQGDEKIAQFLSRYTSHGVSPLTAEDYRNDGWGAAILDTMVFESGGRKRSRNPDLIKAGYEEAVMRNVMWWDDLLHFPSHEEICMMMAHAYADDRDLLRFGWKDNPEFFTDEVKGILTQRTTSLPPGMEAEEEVVGGNYAVDDTLDDDAADVNDADLFVPPSRSGTKRSATIPRDNFENVDDMPVVSTPVKAAAAKPSQGGVKAGKSILEKLREQAKKRTG